MPVIYHITTPTQWDEAQQKGYYDVPSLKEEGFIRNYEIIEEANSVKKTLKVFLKYVDGESVIHEITRYSTPGCRRYAGAKSIKPVIGGLGLSILTTNRGVMSHKSAQTMGVGGEIICTVW